MDGKRFLTAMPGASVYGIREGLRSQGAKDNQTVLITEDLMDSKSLFLTPNTETVYNLVWLDLKNGPVVIESPPNVIGIVDDFWFHYVGDVGNAGPDKGKGGKIVVLLTWAERLHRSADPFSEPRPGAGTSHW